ncbi:MAG TPA: OmpA family protein [Rhizomicrobium sp.]|jgi:outer membrane protein OmpA-like peptidoglycan-associated protein|nr:OmpA family protein [Rhizomicrobium sp.]
MRHLKLALLASAWLAWPGIALSQTVERGSDVTVNPVARGGGTLLYPGGQYMRVVHPLLQPGETARDTGAVHLHMPAKRSAQSHKIEAAADQAPAPKRVRQARVEPKPEPAPSPPAKEAKAAPAPKAEPAPKPVRQAKAEGTAVATVPATSQPAYNPGYSGYTDQGAAGLNFATPAPLPPAAPQSAASAPKAQPKQMAKANPPPASAAPAQAAAELPTPGLTKRSVILFAPQAADPAQSALGAIKFLAGDLNAAMNSASARVQIQAFGGNRGDKSSDARRLSLKRALAIRQVLIDDGVPAERIDVRAMGGADDSGPADRVDVYVKA